MGQERDVEEVTQTAWEHSPGWESGKLEERPAQKQYRYDLVENEASLE